MAGMVKALPPLPEGADEWIEAVQTCTVGQILAVGDLRALLYRSLDQHRAIKLLKRAGIETSLPDSTPFNNHRHTLWEALREKYPGTPANSTVTAFKWEDNEPAVTYMDRATLVWRKAFKEHHEGNKASTLMYREMVVKGLPSAACTALAKTVGLAAMANSEWEAHVKHHLTEVRDSNKEEGDEERQLRIRLLRTQIKNEERTEAEVSKQKKVVAKATQGAYLMEQVTEALAQVNQAVQVQHPLLAHQPLPQQPAYPTVPAPVHYQQGPSQVPGYPPYVPPPTPWPYQTAASFRCYNCDREGHFARECRVPKKHMGRGRGRPAPGD